MKIQIIKLAIILVSVLLVKVNAAMITADADGFAEGADISNAFTGMTLSSIGTTAELDGRVYGVSSPLATTGTMVFGNNLENSTAWYRNTNPPWNPADYALRIDFVNAANMVSIDMVALNNSCYMYLWAYNSEDILVGGSSSDGANPPDFGEIFIARITRDDYDIAYVIIGGFFGNVKSEAVLDNFSANVVPEPGTVLLLGLGGVMAFRRKR